jgi:hypothetical protein
MYCYIHVCIGMYTLRACHKILLVIHQKYAHETAAKRICNLLQVKQQPDRDQRRTTG